jgi:hypothetical protein
MADAYPGRHLLAVTRRHQPYDVGLGESAEPQPEGVDAGEQGEGVAEVVTDLGLGLAGREDEQKRKGADPRGQAAEDSEGVRVGPVQVVEDEADRPLRAEGAQRGGEALGRAVGRGVGVGRPAGRGLVAEQRVEPGRPDPVVADQSRDGLDPRRRGRAAGLLVSPPRAAAEADRRRLGEDRLGQPGLADARLTADQGDRPLSLPYGGEQLPDCGQGAVAADQVGPGALLGRDGPRSRGGRRWCLRSGRPRCRPWRGRCRPGRRGQCGVLPEQRLLEGLELRAGIETELVGKEVAGPSHRLQGVGLPLGAVEGQGQQPPQPLAQRVGGDQGLELRNGPAWSPQARTACHRSSSASSRLVSSRVASAVSAGPTAATSA